jgi:hypothetical protein
MKVLQQLADVVLSWLPHALKGKPTVLVLGQLSGCLAWWPRNIKA